MFKAAIGINFINIPGISRPHNQVFLSIVRNRRILPSIDVPAMGGASHNHFLELLSRLTNRFICLSSPIFICHPPPPSVIRAWWTSSTGYEASKRLTREVGDRRWLVRWEPLALCTAVEVALTSLVWFHSGGVHVPQDHSRRYLHSTALQ